MTVSNAPPVTEPPTETKNPTQPGAVPERPGNANDGLPDTLKYKFTFVSEGFFVGRGGKGRWRGVPSGLSAALFKESSANVRRICGGPKGEFFLGTRSSCYGAGIPRGVPIADIVLVAFGPNRGCFAYLSSGRYLWSNVHSTLIDRIDAIGVSEIDYISIGPKDSWALTYKGGGWWTHNVPSSLVSKLRAVAHVKSIILSPRGTHWFIEDNNGGYHYSLPDAWHDDVERILKG